MAAHDRRQRGAHRVGLAAALRNRHPDQRPSGQRPGQAPAGELEAGLKLGAIHAAQSGLVADMDIIADALYGRSTQG